MNKVNTFTSTGSKLIHHPNALDSLKNQNRGTPLSLQIAPTSRCNLKCSFCSNVNRDKHEDLHPGRIKNFLHDMKHFGAKTVEWTGGGDPTQYKYINAMIKHAHELGYKQGFITNGVHLKKKLHEKSLSYLSWIRVSMNALDYVKFLILPKFDGVLGFSYVWHDKTENDIFQVIRNYANLYDAEYVRVVPDCQATQEEQIKHNLDYSIAVRELGKPFFYQAKTFCKPEACYWGYFKPFLLHDGYIYRCSSVVLNGTAERSFHSKFRWMKVEDFITTWSMEMQAFDPKDCDSCVFHEQNKIIQSVLKPNGMEDFI